MTKLSIYEIRDMAVNSGRAVYGVQDLSNLTGKTKPVANVYLSRLVEKGLASRLTRGKISFSDNDLVIASQLIEPSYVSLDSSLLFHGITQQVTKYVQCVTTVNSFTFRNIGLQYHKIPPELYFGYERHAVGLTYAFVAEPAKALLDGLYLNYYAELEIESLKDMVDISQIEYFLNRYTGHGSKKIKKVIASLKKAES